MRVLLGSGGFRTPERIALLGGLLREHFGAARRLLFIPYALADHDGYVRKLTELGLNAGYELDGIHRHADPQRAVAEAEGIYVGGGNTFRLVDALYRFNLIDGIRKRVREGMPYFGVSAGANVACPSMKTTNDMPIVMPPRFEALHLVAFQINPHYFGGGFFVKHGEEFVAHFGETRDDRLREFHEMNETPVVGLWEGGVLRCRDGRIDLLGAAARIFRRGQEPVDIDPPADLTALLTPSHHA